MKIRCASILLCLFVASLLLQLSACGDDDPVRLAVVYGFGTIFIDAPDSFSAQWTCTRSGGDPLSGNRDTTLTGMPVGVYLMEWEQFENRWSPGPETRSLGAGDTLSFVAIYGPEEPVIVPRGWFFDVLGTAENDAVAVGTDGTIIQFDGTEWSRVDLDESASIRSLVLADDMWACGTDGGIWRRNGGVWSAVYSGTDEDLYDLGLYNDELYAGGREGTLQRYDQGVWNPACRRVINRDPPGVANLDTLHLTNDQFTITSISHFGIGGSYYPPEYEGSLIGIEGTQGMVLRADDEFDWALDPLDMTPTDPPEWVMCMTSDSTNPERNYLGTAAGRLFRLTDSGSGDLDWVPVDIGLINAPEESIHGLWLAANDDLYLATSTGRVIYLPAAGSAQVIFSGDVLLASIWGTDPGNLWVTGLWTNQLLHLNHDPVGGITLETFWDVPVE